MKTLPLLLLLCACATTSKVTSHNPTIPTPPPLPPLPAGASVPRTVAKAAPVRASALPVTAPCPNCAHCFNGPFAATIFNPNDTRISQWDQLVNGWFYTFQTTDRIGGEWVTAQTGSWTSSDPTAYYGLNLPNTTNNQFQRAFGVPMTQSLLSSRNIVPLKVSYKTNKK